MIDEILIIENISANEETPMAEGSNLEDVQLKEVVSSNKISKAKKIENLK